MNKKLFDQVVLPLALVAAVFVPLACMARWRAAVRAPVQGWWEERGPVVPHDGFPADCTLCHEGGDWQTIRQDFAFDHLAETGVPLNGAHAVAECLRCHNDRGPVALFAQRGCAGCHEDIHRGQMGQDCTTCHDESDWRPEGPIAQHASTRLPLAGAHAALQCWACHTGASVGNFKNTDPNCVSCHLDDYQSTTNPNHVAENYPTSCEDCHGFVAFDQAAIFNHAGIVDNCVSCHLANYQGTTDPDHEAEGFPTSCEDCHASFATWRGAFFNHAGIVGNCASCHLEDYQGTTDPDHEAQSFPTSCEDCHSSFATWRGAAFSHTGITTNCVSCHMPDYQGTTDPDHEVQHFPTSCEDCHHTFSTWQGATFSHSGITSNCRSCHLTDYQATTNPKHSTAGFAQTCETCHTSTTTWQGAHYNAHQFPIYSGAHRNFDCTQCHLTNTDYNAFSCTHCHTHRQSVEDPRHRGRSGYSWQSSACYHCHPNGRG